MNDLLLVFSFGVVCGLIGAGITFGAAYAGFIVKAGSHRREQW